ncbi:hypothetical protein [Streptomyces sp. NPDC050422]|uniref:hypothetical protein n=1 Tax=Streptomyces sp. NPDC050422 TaxID=3365614 RepID=UPI0037B3BDFF
MGEETGEELDGFTGQGEGLELVVVEWLDDNLSEVGVLGEVTADTSEPKSHAV